MFHGTGDFVKSSLYRRKEKGRFSARNISPLRNFTQWPPPVVLLGMRTKKD